MIDEALQVAPLTFHPDRHAAFTSLAARARTCHACNEMTYAHVLGEANGSLDAGILFVAEAVGRRGGAVTGVPLTRDESGRRFNTFLEIAGIERTEAFVTNAVLCNPVDASGRNRAPAAAEIARCRPFLAQTLDVVRAPIVVTLGRVALESLRAIVRHDADLPAHVARPVAWHDRTLVPMYHPGRQSTLHRPHATQVEDWCRLGETLRALRRD
jgi:uracil-DNA glycosylase family 4